MRRLCPDLLVDDLIQFLIRCVWDGEDILAAVLSSFLHAVVTEDFTLDLLLSFPFPRTNCCSLLAAITALALSLEGEQAGPVWVQVSLVSASSACSPAGYTCNNSSCYPTLM